MLDRIESLFFIILGILGTGALFGITLGLALGGTFYYFLDVPMLWEGVFLHVLAEYHYEPVTLITSVVLLLGSVVIPYSALEANLYGVVKLNILEVILGTCACLLTLWCVAPFIFTILTLYPPKTHLVLGIDLAVIILTDITVCIAVIRQSSG